MFQRFSAFLAFAALLALAGCSSSKSQAVCPSAAALVETSNLTGFAPGATPDPAHALYRIAISNVTTDCSYDKYDREVTSSVDIHFIVTRPSAGDAAHYRVPFFVAVRQGTDVIAKRVFEANFAFDAGSTSVTFDEPVDSTVIKVAREKQPYDYQILVGLQLTREQLDYNRKTGYYGP